MFQLLLVLALLAAAFVLAAMLAPKGWRTIAFNAVAGLPVAGAEIANVLGGFDWTKVMSPQNASWAGLAVLVLNAALRAMTSTPIGKGS